MKLDFCVVKHIKEHAADPLGSADRRDIQATAQSYFASG